MRIPSVLTSLCLIGALALACGGGEAPPITAPVVPVDAPVTPPPVADPAGDPWSGQGYTGCEAHLLAQHWQVGRDEATSRATSMITGGRPDGVEKALAEAREKVAGEEIDGCGFELTSFTFADAEALARAWGIGVDEAKATLASKATWGMYREARELIEGARTAPAAPEPDPDERALSAFLRSTEVDYCHARMLSNAWGASVEQAKVILGHKLVSENHELLQQTLGEARAHARARVEARCDWSDLPYAWSDAEALAKLWGTDTERAKARVLDMYLDGTDRDVPGILRRAQRG